MRKQRPANNQPHIPAFLARGLTISLVVAFLMGGAYVGYLFYFTVKDAVASARLPTMPYVDLSLPLGVLPLTGDESGQLPLVLPVVRGGAEGATGVTGVPLPDYERKERVNILLLGIDKRPDEQFSRTDTMILATVDPNTKTAGMLSIPRDLWVSIPGYGEDRINKAYFFGERDGYPGGGPALAMKTVQYNLGVPVHFYAQIDFDGFRQVIDTLGGIEIYVPETINDPTFPDNNYGYDPFYIEKGYHTLDGYNTLRYARTRATPGSDFSRARRQQAVLMAIRDKALQLNMVPKIPELWNTMSGAFRTNLELVDILELSKLADEIGPEDIQTAVLDYNYTYNYTVPETGAQVLIPLRDKIRELVDEMFAETDPAEAGQPPAEVVQAQQTAQAQARAQEIEQNAQQQEEIKTLLAQEGARLVVQNGTNITGLASQTALFLKQQGFNIVQFGPADVSTYPHTVIVVYDEGKNYTLEVLKALFNVSEENVRRSPNLKSDIDFRVIIGSDVDLPGLQSLTTTE
ncbi:MAG: LytR family transcriptional regulator [Chloroflexi bacterium]|nr:MAG: LytR family transcriptional regulator [Chloroflexota bacterium]